MMADMIGPNRLVGTWLLTGLLQPRRLVHRLLVYGPRLGHGFLVYRFGFERRSLMRSKLPARWFRTMPRAGSGPLGGPLFGRPLLGGLRCRTSVDRLPGRRLRLRSRRLRLRSRRLMVGLGRTRWTVRSRGATGTR